MHSLDAHRNSDDDETFVRTHADAVYRLALRIVGDPAAAEDVVQEAFIKLFQRRRAALQQNASRSYVLRVAYTTAVDVLRRRQTRRLHEERAARRNAERVELSAENHMTLQEDVERLYAEISSLPVELSTTIHLRAVEELSYAEIARITGVSQLTVGTRLLRARRELTRRLGGVLAGTGLSAALTSLRSAEAQTRFPSPREAIVRRIVETTPGGASLPTVPVRPRPTTPLRLGKLFATSLLVIGVGVYTLVWFLQRPEPERPVAPVVVTPEHTPESRDGDAATSGAPDPTTPATPETTTGRVRLRGRLVDGPSNTPLARKPLLVGFEHGHTDDFVRRYLRSRADGRFETELADYGPQGLFIEAAGYRSSYLRIPASLPTRPGATWDLGDVVLHPGLLVRLRVTDGAGQPIGAARVRHRYSNGRSGADWERLGGSTRTDADGYWEQLGFRPRTSLCVEVSADGFAPRLVWFEPEGDIGPIPVVLEAAGEFRGRLLDAHRHPIPNHALTLRGPDGASNYLRGWGYWTRAVATTDGDGRFRATCPAGRRLRLGVRKAPFVSRELAPLKEGEQRDVGELVVDTATIVHVIVENEKGERVPSCRVTTTLGETVRTGEQGVASVIVADSGTILAVSDHRFRTHELALDGDALRALAGSKGTPPTVRLTARAGPSLFGSVRDSNGHFVDQGYVAIETEGIDTHFPHVYTNLDDDGNFYLPSTPGTPTLETPWRLTASSYSVVEDFLVTEFPEDGRTDIEIAATDWPTVRLSVRGIDGQPVRRGDCRAYVVIPDVAYFQDSAPIRSGSAHLRTFGRDFYRNYPAGKLRGQHLPLELILDCEGQGGSGPVPLGWLADDTEVTVDLQPFGAIHGRVSDSDGRPVPGARVFRRYTPRGATTSHSPSTSPRATYTDEDGTFKLTHLLAGSYAVAVHGGGYAASVTQSIDVDFSEVQEIEIELPEAGSIDGKVMDRNGQPVADVTVAFRIQALADVVAGELYSPEYPVTDADGRFTYHSLPEGRIQGVVSGHGAGGKAFEKSFISEVQAGETLSVTVELD